MFGWLLDFSFQGIVYVFVVVVVVVVFLCEGFAIGLGRNWARPDRDLRLMLLGGRCRFSIVPFPLALLYLGLQIQ